MVQKQKGALVTGGGRGIGRGIARRLLEEGWRVAIAEVDPKLAWEAAEALAPHGELLPLVADVAREKDLEGAVETAASEFGGLDLLVNNAGIMVRKPLADLSLAEWNHVLAVNLTAAMLASRGAAPHLKKGRGAIVNIASTRALMSEPHTEAYAASKGGLVALTHALALSLGPEIRVNCVSPGWIETSSGAGASLTEADHAQHPAGRVGRPEDVAALVLYLASEQSGFVTGQNFVVDGGMTRKMVYD